MFTPQQLSHLSWVFANQLRAPSPGPSPGYGYGGNSSTAQLPAGVARNTIALLAVEYNRRHTQPTTQLTTQPADPRAPAEDAADADVPASSLTPLLWSLARAHAAGGTAAPAPELTAAALLAVRRLGQESVLDTLAPQDLARLTWALGRLRCRAPFLTELLARRLIPLLPKLRPGVHTCEWTSS